MIDAKEFQKIVRICRKEGILKLKSGDFELELKEKDVPKKRQQKDSGEGPPVASVEEPFPSWEDMTPMQRLLWSSTPDAPTS